MYVSQCACVMGIVFRSQTSFSLSLSHTHTHTHTHTQKQGMCILLEWRCLYVSVFIGLEVYKYVDVYVKRERMHRFGHSFERVIYSQVECIELAVDDPHSHWLAEATLCL